MKKGTTQLLDLAILSLLKGGEMHGYQIRKNLAEMAGPLFQFSFGSLYPALGRLEERGAVTSSLEPNLGFISTTGSLSGDLASRRHWDEHGASPALYDRSVRTKRTYCLTDLGEKLFDQLFENTPVLSETEYIAWLYLADEKKLDLVLDRSRERLARLEATKRKTFGSASMANVGIGTRSEIHLRLMQIYESEIAFIKKLIDKLSSGSLTTQ